TVVSAEVAALAAAASDDAPADEFPEALVDDLLGAPLPVVVFFAVVVVLPLAAADGAAVVDGAGEEADGADDVADGAGAGAGCDGGAAGGAGGGLGGAAASISSENGVSGAPPGGGGVGDENVECRFDGRGGAGDATADTRHLKAKTGAPEPAIAGPAGC